MIKFIYFFILLFWIQGVAHSGGDPFVAGIMADLSDMLRNPMTPGKAGESFATYITRPFAQNPDQDMSLLSNPSYERWNPKYRAYTGKGVITAFEVFRTMAISRRAVLINGSLRYGKISDAETMGILGILRGSMGLKSTSLSTPEKEIVARELLHMGRSLRNDEVMRRVQEFGSSYAATSDARKRRHFQTLALLLLSGHNRSMITTSEWYLKDVKDRDALLAKVYGYADLYLPKGTVPVVGDSVDVVAGFAKRYGELPDLSRDALKRLIFAAQRAEWGDSIDGILNEPVVQEATANIDLAPILESIQRLNSYMKGEMPDSNSYEKGERADKYEYGVDANNLTKIYRKLFPPTVVRGKAPADSIREYLAGSLILNMFSGAEKAQRREAYRDALLSYVGKNGRVWPGYDLLKANEQFFWNLYMPHRDSDVVMGDYEKAIFEGKIPGSWEDFLRFCEPYIPAGQQQESRTTLRQHLFLVYQAFPKAEQRAAFFAFCEPYLTSIPVIRRPLVMTYLLSIYKDFPEMDSSREAFIDFCRPYLVAVNAEQIPQCMAALLPVYHSTAMTDGGAEFAKFISPYLRSARPVAIADLLDDLCYVYQAFEEPTVRKAFLDFCSPNFSGFPTAEQPSVMRNLLPVYQAFETSDEREEFMGFCSELLVNTFPNHQLFHMKKFLASYKAFGSPEERDEFFTFCNPFIEGVSDEELADYLSALHLIYQAFEEPTERDEFITFCQAYTPADINIFGSPSLMATFLSIYQNNKEDFRLFVENLRPTLPVMNADVLQSFLPRNYLKYVRINAALMAEEFPNDARIQAMYETQTDQQLPVIWVEDHNVQYAREVVGARANAHDFDKVYEEDRQTLFRWCETQRYDGKKAARKRDLYGTTGKIENYQTNVEVEDFLKYLEDKIEKGPDRRIDGIMLTGEKIALIIKQLLGLEVKKAGTTGGFAPYLGHSMYYANPTAPLGDEMLGRVWFFMKQISPPKDVEDNKMSVILSMLEASEISRTQVSTHCQTRMTGELMKLIAFKLPGSKLRPLIAAPDVVAIGGDAKSMKDRIDDAYLAAQSLFDRLKSDTSLVQPLYERAAALEKDVPELWEFYQVYYDALYRRTKNADGNGYKRDNNILMRDERGNLVQMFDAAGRIRAPTIVYYQAEFQAIEQIFTALLGQEFEERRGLVY